MEIYLHKIKDNRGDCQSQNQLLHTEHRKKDPAFVPNKEELNDQHNYFSCQSSKRGTLEAKRGIKIQFKNRSVTAPAQVE